jgi:hypothetical protein
MNNLINPFTRSLITNAWTDAARKASAEARKRKKRTGSVITEALQRRKRKPQYIKAQYQALQKAAGDQKITYHAPSHFGRSPEMIQGATRVKSTKDIVKQVATLKGVDPSLLPDSVWQAMSDDQNKTNPPHVKATRGKYARETMAHEIGHHLHGHWGVKGEPTFVRDAQETEAWKWAEQNKKNLQLSGRKMRRLARMSEDSYGVPRGTFVKYKPPTANEIMEVLRRIYESSAT